MAKSRRGTASQKNTSGFPAPLAAEALRWRCDWEDFPFDTTADVEPVAGVVGQDLAVEAVRYGLATNAPGQNVFVRGLTGTGRLTMVRRLLEDLRLTCPLVKDCCYVHNFSQPDRPRLITLEAGRGAELQRRVGGVIRFIRDHLAPALTSKGVSEQRTLLDQETEKKLKELVVPFEETLKQAGLTLVTLEAGPVMQTTIYPLVEGKAVDPEEFDELHRQGEVTDEQFNAVRERYDEYSLQLSGLNERANKIRRKHSEAVGKLFERSARSLLEKLVSEVQDAFPDPVVRVFLSEVVEDVVSNRLGNLDEGTKFTRLYQVNVVSGHEAEGGCPIVVETAPTLRNLLGTVDYEYEPGDDVRPNHVGIRAGSLLRADGGFLILEDREVLDEPDAWKALKRVLRTGKLEISAPGGPFPGWAPALKPDPIDVDVKVVLLGDPWTYALLDEFDADFGYLFKVLADFDDVIERNDEGCRHYAAVLAHIARNEQLLPFDRGAVGALIEFGARIAASRGKLSARFGRVADIAREAAFIAAEGSPQRPKRVSGRVSADDVRRAVRRGKQRANLPARRFRELVADGTIRVETTGSAVGQINGLAVLQAGPMVYGFPTRVTATIGPGTAGVINIDREAALSGAIHTKGFYILGGLLRYLLRTDHPLAFDASVAFEQSYGAIDGDSASGAEICCLLSALTDIPIRQGLAMTGAIDQRGNILAVGAVNEKVEGFYDVCRELGTAEGRGVIIPRANAGDLMLREDLVEACAAGTFQVYAIERVHEALALLTGQAAGTRGARGKYPKDTVLGIAVKRAREYWLKAARQPPSTKREDTPRATKKKAAKRKGRNRE
ncbi:MAG: ATP-binding protein [Phycisphaerae bacterium]|jgi:ATP-dependent Lon protease